MEVTWFKFQETEQNVNPMRKQKHLKLITVFYHGSITNKAMRGSPKPEVRRE